MQDSIYITYNPNSQIEENTALRLQTISHLYGMNVNLPYRNLGVYTEPKEETKKRINASSLVVAFSLEHLSEMVLKEINYSLSKKKLIIVVIDSKYAKEIALSKEHPNIGTIGIDKNNPYSSQTLEKIASFAKTFSENKKKKEKEESSAGLALVGVGISLLALYLMNKDD